jgi:thiol:disulfide interchange protein DsbD
LLPPDLSRQEVPRGDTLWRSDADAGLAEAKVQKKPVLLDFRADWCVACLELERNTWPDPGVESLLATTIPVRMDMTRKTDANDALQRRFGVLGLPTVILVAPSGAELGRFTGYKNAEAFTEWFRSVGPESGGRREGAPGVHGGGS